MNDPNSDAAANPMNQDNAPPEAAANPTVPVEASASATLELSYPHEISASLELATIAPPEKPAEDQSQPPALASLLKRFRLPLFALLLIVLGVVAFWKRTLLLWLTSVDWNALLIPFLSFVGAGVVLLLWLWPGVQLRHQRQRISREDYGKLDPKDRAALEKDLILTENSIRTTWAQIIGGLLLLGTIYTTWQNVRVAEEGKITDRFSKAVEMLGSDKLDVRLGGIYALERIAYDSQKDHWTVMEVLTAYVREHAKKPSAIKAEKGSEKMTAPEIQKLVTFKPPADIQAILTVIGRRKEEWRRLESDNQQLDLRETDLHGADLRMAHLDSANLDSANLDGAILGYAKLNGARLNGASLNGALIFSASLHGANLSDASFNGTILYGTILYGATFYDSIFSKRSIPQGLTWGQLSQAHLDDKTILPPELEQRRQEEKLKRQQQSPSK